MIKLFAILGALLSFLSVALGAFAAHGLKNRLTAEYLEIFQVGVQYQFYHALALLLVALFGLSMPGSMALRGAGWSFLVGILLFSGSLYLLTLTGTRWLGAITPLGGTAFLVGWLCLAWALYRGLLA